MRHAEQGVSFGAACAEGRELVRRVLPRLIEAHAREPERLAAVLRVATEFADRYVMAVASGYMAYKDATLRGREDALRQWERIFQHATWGVAAVGASDLRFQAVNPAYAEMHGYTVDELVGAPVSKLWAPETRGDMERHAGETHEHGRLVVETTHLKKDGSKLPVEVVGTTIKDAAGDVVSFVANVQDISERRRLQQAQIRAIELEAENRRIEEANRLKSEFLANMSHELRTPLNSIIGFAELMHDGHVGTLDPKQKEFIGEILAGGVHLLRLINDVLDLAKIEAGKLEFRPEPIQPEVMLGAVVQSLRGALAGKELAVEIHASPVLTDLVLDPVRFRQLLYNYVSNAFKFTPDGGRVSVRALPEGAEQFRIEVEDTGPGVSTEDARRLFVPFEQLDSGTTKRHGGTGLGLALTKRLAEAQGGSVGMRRAPAGGSIFFAVLPRRLAETGARSDAPPATRERSAPPEQGSPVVVVDDDPSSLKLMEVTLAGLGHAASCFSQAADAVSALDRVRPLAIILDLLMPSMDGFTFLERLRELPKAVGVPIMIWTVKDLSSEERERLGPAVTAVVRKGTGDEARLSEALQAFLPIPLPRSDA